MLLLLLVVLMWGAALKAISFKEFQRLEIMKVLGGHEIVSYPIVAILIMGIIGIWYAMFLLLFPIVWYACFLLIIYGKFMPDV